MPNWSYNKIAVRGKKEKVVAWFNKGLAIEKREPLSVDMACDKIAEVLNNSNLSLESFIPMPQTYHDYDTTNQICSVMYWLNSLLYNGKAVKKIQKHFNRWLYDHFGYDNTKMNFVGIERLKKLALKRQTPFIECTRLYLLAIENDEKLMSVVNSEYEKYVEGYNAAKVYQQETYGVVGWYDWCRKNFGCKWNAEFYNVSVTELANGEIVVYFHCATPWSIPNEWLGTMQDENKEDLTFFCRSEEESGLWNGYFCCLEETWREDHEYEFSNIEDDEERWQAEEELNKGIDQRFEDDCECLFETIETE